MQTGRPINELRRTRTYAHTGMVIEVIGQSPTQEMVIYIGDFSQEESQIPGDVAEALETKCVRIFQTMEEATGFLVGYPAIVSSCTVIVR